MLLLVLRLTACREGPHIQPCPPEQHHDVASYSIAIEVQSHLRVAPDDSVLAVPDRV